MDHLQQMQLRILSSGDVSHKEKLLKVDESVDPCDHELKCEFYKKRLVKTEDMKINVCFDRCEKSFECKFCKKTFTQPGHLKKHERIHRREALPV